jgi:hypothetical protein
LASFSAKLKKDPEQSSLDLEDALSSRDTKESQAPVKLHSGSGSDHFLDLIISEKNALTTALCSGSGT